MNLFNRTLSRFLNGPNDLYDELREEFDGMRRGELTAHAMDIAESLADAKHKSRRLQRERDELRQALADLHRQADVMPCPHDVCNEQTCPVHRAEDVLERIAP